MHLIMRALQLLSLLSVTFTAGALVVFFVWAGRELWRARR
jgi:hypothetical protein